MIDRRTYLAGQIVNGMLAYNGSSENDVAVDATDKLLAELQRTCVHKLAYEPIYLNGTQVGYSPYGTCSKCGLERRDDKA